MEITQQADYAVRAVLELALHADGGLISSGPIAWRQNIPYAFLSKILARLAAEQIVFTQRGVNGGIRLARPADQITLLQVVEAIDGPVTLNRCNRAPGECPRDSFCAVHPIWASICFDLRAKLSGITFADLAASARSAIQPRRQPAARQMMEVPIANNP